MKRSGKILKKLIGRNDPLIVNVTSNVMQCDVKRHDNALTSVRYNELTSIA